MTYTFERNDKMKYGKFEIDPSTLIAALTIICITTIFVVLAFNI